MRFARAVLIFSTFRGTKKLQMRLTSRSFLSGNVSKNSGSLRMHILVSVFNLLNKKKAHYLVRQLYYSDADASNMSMPYSSAIFINGPAASLISKSA